MTRHIRKQRQSCRDTAGGAHSLRCRGTSREGRIAYHAIIRRKSLPEQVSFSTRSEIFQHSPDAMRAKESSYVPWKHGKAGASPAIATISNHNLNCKPRNLTGSTRRLITPGRPGDVYPPSAALQEFASPFLNRLRKAKRSPGLPPTNKEAGVNCKPRRLDPGLITLVTRSVTGACHQFSSNEIVGQALRLPPEPWPVHSRRAERSALQ